VWPYKIRRFEDLYLLQLVYNIYDELAAEDWQSKGSWLINRKRLGDAASEKWPRHLELLPRK